VEGTGLLSCVASGDDEEAKEEEKIGILYFIEKTKIIFLVSWLPGRSPTNDSRLRLRRSVFESPAYFGSGPRRGRGEAKLESSGDRRPWFRVTVGATVARVQSRQRLRRLPPVFPQVGGHRVGSCLAGAESWPAPLRQGR